MVRLISFKCVCVAFIVLFAAACACICTRTRTRTITITRSRTRTWTRISIWVWWYVIRIICTLALISRFFISRLTSLRIRCISIVCIFFRRRVITVWCRWWWLSRLTIIVTWVIFIHYWLLFLSFKFIQWFGYIASFIGIGWRFLITCIRRVIELCERIISGLFGWYFFYIFTWANWHIIFLLWVQLIQR